MKKNEYPHIGETLYSAVLPNGLRFNLIPKNGFNTGYAAFAVNYGGAQRKFALEGELKDTPAGVAHFLEHKMFDMPDGDNALETLSANGADPNAFTSSGMTCYYFQCTKNFEENLRLLLRFVSTPYFTPETVAKEQGIIAQEILMGEDSPGTVLYYDLLGLLYERHPIRDRVAGTVESIAEISDKVLYDCHKAFYSPANMTVCVEGDFDPEHILSIVRQELPETSSSVPTADFGLPEGALPRERLSTRTMPVSAPQFFIGAKLVPAQSDTLLKQHIVSQLAMRMLVGEASPFYMRLYEKGLLNRDFGFDVDYTAGTAYILVGGESEHAQTVLEELNTEIASVCKNGFDRDYFERCRRASLGARLRGLEDFENVCISVIQGVFDGYCALDAFEALEKVTQEDCRAFIADTLAPERLALAIIQPGRK